MRGQKSPDVLFVTKPLAPPWDDSGKVLPYLIAKHLTTVCPQVLTARGHGLDIVGAVQQQIYSRPASFNISLADRVRLFFWLTKTTLPPIVHFFFSPNWLTVSAARLLKTLRSQAIMVQTVMSLPQRPETLAHGVFADTVVVWSEYAKRLALDATRQVGFSGRIVHIPPGIVPLQKPAKEEKDALRKAFGLRTDRPVVLYAGDLEFSSAAGVVAEAIKPTVERTEAAFVFACREKTHAAKAVLVALTKELADGIQRGDVHVFGTITRFHDLLRCADVLVLPAETSYAKTDIPLVVLEALSAGIPAVVATGTPAQELVDAGAAVGVPPLDPKALASVLIGLLSGSGRAQVLGETGRRYVLERHTAQHMATLHENLYRMLLRESGYYCGARAEVWP